MKKTELTKEQLDKVISLQQIGTSWLKIQHETGINRRTAKRSYEKWDHSRSLDELKEARKDVATQAFREHMDSLVTLATSLVTNLNVPDSPDTMDKNAEQFFSGLFEQDLLGRGLYMPSSQTTEAYASSSPRLIVDLRFYHREKELLFESLKIHTREGVRWEDVLDNRWKKAKDNCAKILPKLRKETMSIVTSFLNQKRQMNLLQRIKEGSGKDDPAERMAEVVFNEIWRAILRDKLDEEGPFQTELYRAGPPQEIYEVRCRDETVIRILENNNERLDEEVKRICNCALNILCKGDTARKLRDGIRDMGKASEELREMLNPVRLRPMILRTRCDLCPA
jgi:hypothetical protein